MYHHVLGELGGAHGREIKEALGPANIAIYVAIRERLFERARGPERHAETLELDAIDWAAIRVIAPLVLKHGYEQEFQMLTDFTFDELAALLRRAKEQVRQFRYGAGTRSIYYQLGTCEVRLPAAKMLSDAGGDFVVGVPDDESWDRVMPRCAAGLRREFLDAFVEALASSTAEWRFVERSVESRDDLEAWIDELRRPYLEKRAEDFR